MEKLNIKNSILIGFTLFSMFFGAGNLIFPPLLGAQSGSSFLLSILGFLLMAVVVPSVTVIVVARHQGLKNLTDQIHPYFTLLFVTLVYLLIGPCVAIPRTASTSFEMALTPLIQEDNRMLFQIVYSLLFFTLAGLVALKPNKLKNLLGKFMTPILLILILIVFLGAVFFASCSYWESLYKVCILTGTIRNRGWISDHGYFGGIKFWNYYRHQYSRFRN